MYTKKTSSITILALLALSAVTLIVPVAAVYGSTGHPDIGIVTNQAALTGFAAATSYVNVTAGGAGVAGTDCGATFPGTCAASGWFAINFNSGSMLFSGSQFALYLSKDGFSQISASDIPIAGTLADNSQFSVAKTFAVGVTTVNEQNGTYYEGNSGYFSGPIPADVSNVYKYVKIFDGSSTSVAVSKEFISIMPGISIKPVCTGVGGTPSGCAAGTVVQLLGGGFASGHTISINYTYPFYTWTLGTNTTKTGTWVSGISTGPGYFAYTETMLDVKQAQNPLTLGVYYTPIWLEATNSSVGGHESFIGTAITKWSERPRTINEVESWKPDGTVDTNNNGPYGNDSGSTFIYGDVPIVNIYPTGSIGVAGNNTFAGGSVTVTLGTASATATSNTWGWYVANLTVPLLSLGHHTVTVSDNGVVYMFTVNVVPTLVLTPSSGPVGTLVTAHAYGFPSNKWVSLWWAGLAFGDGNSYLLANGTVDSTGSYNVTMQFTVAHTYGGAHTVDATFDTWPSPVSTTTLEAGANWVASASFTVTPTCGVNPGSVNDNGSWVTFWCNGVVAPGQTCVSGGDNTECTLAVSIDNSAYAPTAPNGYHTSEEVAANGTGDLSVNFVAAGFRPGLHVVSLGGPNGPFGTGSSGDVSNGMYTPYSYALFTVTTTGDPISDQLTSLNTAVSGLSTSLSSIQNSLTSIQTSLTSVMSSLSGITSSLSGITSSLSTITSTLSAVQSSLSGITSSLSNVQSSLSTITGDVSGLGSQLTSLQQTASQLQSTASSLSTQVGNLGSTLTSMQSSLSSMSGQLSSIATDAHTAATQATAAAGSAANAVNGNSTAQTYVLVVAVLAAITLVLELAILVRKLS